MGHINTPYTRMCKYLQAFSRNHLENINIDPFRKTSFYIQILDKKYLSTYKLYIRNTSKYRAHVTKYTSIANSSIVLQSIESVKVCVSHIL